MSTLLVLIILVLIVWLYLQNKPRADGFGVEKRPFNYGNEYKMVNPFDEMDYITPMFYRY